jgi:urease accessory protein UreE
LRWPIYLSEGKVEIQKDYNLDDYIEGLGKTTDLERRMVKSKELRTGKSLIDRSNEET